MYIYRPVHLVSLPTTLACILMFAGLTSQYASLQAQETSELQFLSGIRQLTLDGRRAGEGYFSADGRMMVFQSERQADNPFYQIYLMDLETGDLDRVSDGTGKTTCAWIHSDGNHVLFASTQGDADRLKKQQEELDFRASGQERRYSWDYDPAYELYVWDRPNKSYQQLTKALGYDAEASYSPDGKQIVFASNRNAYSRKLSETDQQRLDLEPSRFIDLYLMDADGSNVRQLTDVDGYDGGPFFSPDGLRICWRRFSPTGVTAEIYTMRLDGSDVRQLTQLKAMSWAPYFHTSGEYLIFTTNIHGFANFELYLVRADGNGEPVRVTSTDKFDGLPVFMPDGRHLAWTSSRGAGGQSQIYVADWNDAAARKALELDQSPIGNVSEDTREAAAAARQTSPDFSPADIMRHVDYLCRPELGGRFTGSEGEQRATAYVAAYLESLGLQPAGENGSFFHPFEFTAGVELGPNNRLAWGDKHYETDRQWRPTAFSQRGEIASAPVVFAGYGIATPEGIEGESYDSYVHLDVADRWVMVFRGLPNQLADARRQQLSAYSSLRYKAMAARDRGAKGLIVVSGPLSDYRESLVPLKLDGAMSGSSIAIVSVTDEVANEWLGKSEETLVNLQTELDDGSMMMGFEIKEVTIAMNIDLIMRQKTGRNVIARLAAGNQPTNQLLLVGAHIDHLGQGANANSLARDDEREGIHRGADDNASGVAAVLEIAQYLADQQRAGKLQLKRDVLVAAWSGEELGLLGSAAFAEDFYKLFPQLSPPENDTRSLYPSLVACLNLDMVGRLREKLVLQGIGSSSQWKGEIERRNVPVGMSLTLQNDSYLPTDASTFFLRGVPILSAFTGSHSEYHTPRDVPETLNYDGASQTARLMALLTRGIATREAIPDFVPQQAPQNQPRGRMTAYLGTIPDYATEDVKGVKLNGVAKDGPAEKAGVRGGDTIIELNGKKVENIYDYTYAIEGLRAGKVVEIIVERDRQPVKLNVVPGSRE